MRSADSYSELECLILGFIARGINSGYSMRKALHGMHGNTWSIESGSIYRALRRLEADDLVKVESRVESPSRQRIEYRLTPTGRMVLQSWLERTPDPDEFERISDPIRVRSYFLELLEPATRLQVIRAWIAGNKKTLESLRAAGIPSDATADIPALALKSLLWQAKARQDWLKLVYELERNPGKGKGLAK